MRATGLILAAVALVAAAAWVGTDRAQRDDAFCVSCHGSDHRGRPVVMHEALKQRFDLRPATNLAAAHAVAGVSERGDDPTFHCIDCHGGTGFVGRLAVKAVSARDTAVWALGRAREPRGMRVPLGDRDCRRCHAEVAAPEAGIGRMPSFHGREEHDDGAEAGCIGCHPVHAQAPAENTFLDEPTVRRECARCHSGFVVR